MRYNRSRSRRGRRSFGRRRKGTKRHKAYFVSRGGIRL